MIGYLKGTIIDITSETCVVLTNGVGYEVQAPLSTLGDLILGEVKEFWIFTNVREDALTLFGFSNQADKAFFLQLLKVNGIGPKMALNILSGGTFDQIMMMIEAEDVKALSKLPKVGKKTAEQMILTLKGKLVKLEEGTGLVRAGAVVDSKSQQLVSALVNLGFKNTEVEKVVSSLPKELSLEDGIRKGLQSLSGLN